MGILRKLREWRENEDGTLEGPSLKTEVLGGDLVDRVEGINHLEGNIYLTEEGAPDPTENDGDLWFEYESE